MQSDCLSTLKRSVQMRIFRKKWHLIFCIAGFTAIHACKQRIATEKPAPDIREINQKEIPKGSKTIAITGVLIIDGNGGEPVTDGCVIVHNGLIAEVGKTSEITLPAEAE